MKKLHLLLLFPAIFNALSSSELLKIEEKKFESLQIFMEEQGFFVTVYDHLQLPPDEIVLKILQKTIQLNLQTVDIFQAFLLNAPAEIHYQTIESLSLSLENKLKKISKRK